MRGAWIVTAGILLGQQFAHGAHGAAPRPDAGRPAGSEVTPAADGSPPRVNLMAFIGRPIEARRVVRHDKPGLVFLDSEFSLRYRVLQVVFGKYPHEEIRFSSFIHMGPPAFLEHEVGLVYVSEYDGRYVQQKYLYQAVYPTADGRWAGCGDPYAGMAEVHRHGVKPEAVDFSPPVVFDLRHLSSKQIAQRYPKPIFRHERGRAICEMGNYPPELFRVMQEGVLTARGVFRAASSRER